MFKSTCQQNVHCDDRCLHLFQGSMHMFYPTCYVYRVSTLSTCERTTTTTNRSHVMFDQVHKRQTKSTMKSHVLSSTAIHSFDRYERLHMSNDILINVQRNNSFDLNELDVKYDRKHCSSTYSHSIIIIDIKIVNRI
jgi:hypothetical protein